MIIKYISIQEGFYKKIFDFTPEANLIHSNQNSCGKTTLLRFILYGIGFNIPNTLKFKFENCSVETELYCETLGDITLKRYTPESLFLCRNEDKKTYILPEQQKELHSMLFGTNNNDILDNILGTFYMDQEKGWTLLNRGIVIGSIHFNIEALIRGLAEKDCTQLLKKEAILMREKQKYTQLFSIAQYRKSVEESVGSTAYEDYYEETDAEINSLRIMQSKLNREIKRIDESLSENKKFRKFVSDMKLVVLAPDGTQIPVTENNILGLSDSMNLLVAKHKITSMKFQKISERISQLESEKEAENEQLAFYEQLSQIEAFDRRIVKIPLNIQSIKKEQNRVDKELKAIRDQISNETKSNNIVVKEMSDDIIRYGTELGIGTEETISESYLFTSNLKELSGALLHKTAFIFRLAYIHAVEKKLGIKLPIILDSPSGKEVDQANIRLMTNILKRDFSNNQIIIASIYSYNFENLKKIEISNHLIEIV